MQAGESVPVAAPVGVPIVQVEFMAVPEPAPKAPPRSTPKADEHERVFGLTTREWTLMGAATAAIVVFAGAVYLGFRALEG